MMNTLTRMLVLLLFCFFLACEEAPNDTNGGANSSVNTTATDTVNGATNSANDQGSANTSTTTPNPQDCEITDLHLDQNVFYATDEAQVITIVANASTKDANLGDSHRILRVLNTTDCSVIFEQTLPINRSADFPYYLVPNTYKFNKQIVAIQGFSTMYYFDIKHQKLVGPVIPQFLEDHEAVDAQSGMIKGLTVWEHYLLGQSLDFGPFAFDIADVSNPKPIVPVAEYTIPNTEEFNNLFILEVKDGHYQAIIPTSDLNAGGSTFDLYKMFPEPLPINPTVSSNVRDNRYIIFNTTTSAGRVVVDMFRKNQVALPDNIAQQNTGAILDWLKTNNR